MSKKSKAEIESAPRSKKSGKAEKPAAQTAMSKTKGKKPVAEKPATPEKIKAPAAKKAQPVAKKPGAVKPTTAKRKLPEIQISNDDIALRAYFIAERREKMGWPGNSASDWLEAEAQLREEARAAARKSAK